MVENAIIKALAESLRFNRWTVTASVYKAAMDKLWREKHGPRRKVRNGKNVKAPK